MYGNYNINDEEKSKGAFTFDHKMLEHTSGVFVGGRDDNTRFLTGAISGIQMYLSKTTKERNCPNVLKSLIIRDQMVVAL